MTPVRLQSRLNIGGRWYLRGDIVNMNDKDLRDYVALRIAKPLSDSEIQGLKKPPDVQTGKPYDPPSFKDEVRAERTVAVGDVITKDGVAAGTEEVATATVEDKEDNKQHSTQGKHNRRR